MYAYSRETQSVYLKDRDSNIPHDAVDISQAKYLEVFANPAPGKIRSHDADGLPILIDPPPYVPTADELCHRIDTAADAARRAVAADPLRAVEYDRTASEARAYAAAGYQGEVPPMVAAWAINGRSPQQAADDILAEAQQYEAALVQLRTLRLAAKEQIRALMAAEQVEQAQQLAAQTVAAIEAAVAGIGNNA